MRKRISSPTPGNAAPKDHEWLDLDKLAEVEITSEDSQHPIDAALVLDAEGEWKATQSGEQTLRLLFDRPQVLKHIRLVFTENEHARTQEFVLRWSNDGKAFHEIVRQQYNFNPPATEAEDYTVNLTGVKVLELKIVPNIGGGTATASLTELRLA